VTPRKLEYEPPRCAYICRETRQHGPGLQFCAGPLVLRIGVGAPRRLMLRGAVFSTHEGTA